MINPWDQPVDPLNKDRPDVHHFKKEMDKRLKEQVIGVFLNPQGEQLLQTLEDLYVRQTVCPPGATKGYGFWREGQNSLILKFQAIIRQAQQVNYE